MVKLLPPLSSNAMVLFIMTNIVSSAFLWETFSVSAFQLASPRIGRWNLASSYIGRRHTMAVLTKRQRVSTCENRSNICMSADGEEEGSSRPGKESEAEENGDEPLMEKERKDAPTRLSPEIIALKEEIAHFEKTLNTKRLEASRLRDEADEYSNSGYLRKCAEMDNFRKRRDMAFSNDKFAARATVVQKFLPILDDLKDLADVTYAGNEFAKQYEALHGDFKSKFEKQLDVKEFHGHVGRKLDMMRCTVASEEYSDKHNRGIVIRQVKSGLEIHGNIIRFAECVVSKGSEADAKKAAAEAKAKAEADAASVKAKAKADHESAQNERADETEEK